MYLRGYKKSKVNIVSVLEDLMVLVLSKTNKEQWPKTTLNMKVKDRPPA